MLEEQRKEAIRKTVAVVYETIQDCKEMSFGGIPDGHLYTMLMSTLDMSFMTYMNVLTFLKENGYVTESNYVLRVTDKPFPWSSGV